MKIIELLDNKVKLYYTIEKKDHGLVMYIKTEKKSKLYYDESKEPVFSNVVAMDTIKEHQIETIKEIMSSKSTALTYFNSEDFTYRNLAQLRIASNLEIPYKK